jgi:hypothetical protein
MSDSPDKINALPNDKPLSALDIKHVLLDRNNQSIAGLARLASKDIGRKVTPWQMRAVIYRYPGTVYQDIREWLAAWLGCEVWQVGNEPAGAQAPEEESQAAAA